MWSGSSSNSIIGCTSESSTAAGQFLIFAPGNVGIGTSSPARTLDVAGDIGAAGNVFVNSPGSNSGNLSPGLNLGGGGEGIASNRTAGVNLFGVDFYTSYMNRMAITNSGAVGIGTTAPDNTLTVNGSADKPSGGSWGTFSDARLKTIDGSFNSGLAQVLKLRPIVYQYKQHNALDIKDHDPHVGLVAQEVQKVIPEAVSADARGFLLLNNDPIIWAMLNAIKEQQAQIRQSQARVKALESKAARVVALQKQSDALKAQNDRLTAEVQHLENIRQQVTALEMRLARLEAGNKNNQTNAAAHHVKKQRSGTLVAKVQF